MLSPAKRIARLEQRQTAQDDRIKSLQGQVSIVSGMLKEALVVQQLLYEKGIINREEVKSALAKQEASLSKLAQKAIAERAVQSSQARSDEADLGDRQS